MKKTINCAVIGCGQIGPVHAACYRHLPNVQLKWACDLIPERAQQVASNFSVPHWTTRYQDVLRDPEVDSISICTDHASHVKLACEAFRHNKHVLCEKALAPTRQGLKTMLRAHARHPSLVFSGVLQHRFDAASRCIHEYLDKDILGTLISCSIRLNCHRANEYYQADAWHGTWEGEGGSVLINQALHFLDLGAWLMGGVTQVSGFYTNRTHRNVIETEDTAVAALRFANGALGTLSATTSDKIQNWDHAVVLYGTEGTLEIRNDALVRLDLEDNKKAARLLKAVQKEQAHWRSTAGKAYYGPSHPLQIADFVDAVRNRRKPSVTARDACHCVDIVLAVYESQRTGKAISLKL